VGHGKGDRAKDEDGEKALWEGLQEHTECEGEGATCFGGEEEAQRVHAKAGPEETRDKDARMAAAHGGGAGGMREEEYRRGEALKPGKQTPAVTY